MFGTEASESESKYDSERDGGWDLYPGGCPLETEDKVDSDESEFDRIRFLAGVYSKVDLLLLMPWVSLGSLYIN
jgi:hypothetical protein